MHTHAYYIVDCCSLGSQKAKHKPKHDLNIEINKVKQSYYEIEAMKHME